MTEVGDQQQRRRSQRVMLQVAVIMTSELPNNQKYEVPAFTLVVNAHGGLLESPVGATVNQRITVTNPVSGKSVQCRVVRVDPPEKGQFKVAFEFFERNAQFWPINFPPSDWMENALLAEEVK